MGRWILVVMLTMGVLATGCGEDEDGAEAAQGADAGQTSADAGVDASAEVDATVDAEDLPRRTFPNCAQLVECCTGDGCAPTVETVVRGALAKYEETAAAATTSEERDEYTAAVRETIEMGCKCHLEETPGDTCLPHGETGDLPEGFTCADAKEVLATF